MEKKKLNDMRVFYVMQDDLVAGWCQDLWKILDFQDFGLDVKWHHFITRFWKWINLFPLTLIIIKFVERVYELK